jgi:hypothetical protein
VLLTTPVSGHVIARASYYADIPLWKGTVLDERRGSGGFRRQPDAAGAGPASASTPAPEPGP